MNSDVTVSPGARRVFALVVRQNDRTLVFHKEFSETAISEVHEDELFSQCLALYAAGGAPLPFYSRWEFVRGFTASEILLGHGQVHEVVGPIVDPVTEEWIKKELFQAVYWARLCGTEISVIPRRT